MIRRARSRSRWYSLSLSVIAGATVIESPVWIPIGSMFSIEQTTTKLSATSRITSSSYSFQPSTDCSTSTWRTGLIDRPRDESARNSSRLYATPPPTPPSVNEGRMIAGKPTTFTNASASSSECAAPESGTSMPIEVIACRNNSRSSATLIASSDAPINSTPKRSSTPASARPTARLSAVWPPTVGRSASGRSRSMITESVSTVSGST